jgi:MFS transporter, MHS family, proline/betaine transporter
MKNKTSSDKALFACMAGSIIEYYDWTLYGFFIPVLTPLFFPSDNLFLSYAESLAIFAVGFLMRPLGGIFFGHLGDRKGRKKALSLSILLVILPTVTIGILPTYDSIGLVAPLILLLCRLMQGFCVGGEYTGAAIFVNEHARKNKAGLWGGLIGSASFIGSVAATSIGFLLTIPGAPSWAWRVAFMAGGLFGLLGFYIRYKVKESPDFLAIKEAGKISKHPLIQTLRTHKLPALYTSFIGGAVFIPLYLSSIYPSVILKTDLQLSSSHIFLISTYIMSLWGLLFPLMGYLADTVGKQKLMSWAAIGFIICAMPVFLLFSTNNWISILEGQTILSILGVAFAAPSVSLLPEIFPANIRYSGLSFSYSVGAALFGGFTPFIAHVLVEWTQTAVAPAAYLMLGGLAAWIALHFLEGGADNRSSPQQRILKEA